MEDGHTQVGRYSHVYSACELAQKNKHHVQKIQEMMNGSNKMALPQGVLAAVDAASATRRRWLRLLEAVVAQLYAKPRTESTLKYAGGVIAAFFAIKYSRSFTSAGFIGLFAGILAHSIYADVLKKARKKRSSSRLPAAGAALRTQSDEGDEHEKHDDERSESEDH